MQDDNRGGLNSGSCGCDEGPRGGCGRNEGCGWDQLELRLAETIARGIAEFYSS